MMKKLFKASAAFAALFACAFAAPAQDASTGVNGVVTFQYPVFMETEIPFSNGEVNLTMHTVSSRPINTVFVDGKDMTEQVKVTDIEKKICELHLTGVTNPHPVVTLSLQFKSNATYVIDDVSAYKVYVQPNAGGKYVLNIEGRNGKAVADDTSVIVTSYDGTSNLIYKGTYKEANKIFTPGYGGAYRVYIGATLSNPNLQVGPMGDDAKVSGGTTYMVMFPKTDN